MSYYFAGRFFDKNRPFFSYDCKDYSFKLDLQVGELYFSRKLISLAGKHLPLDLSLQYVQRHASNTYDDLYLYTGLPKGFKTNYHLFLEYDSNYNQYLLEDIDGFLHKFRRNNSTSDLYHDKFGSGLMLQVSNGEYDVFDIDGNYQHYDQYGRLVTIHKKITNSHYAEQHIYYANNASLKIDHITDNYGRTIYFTYITNQRIEISYDSNTIVTLYHDSNSLLYKVSKDLDDYVSEDLFNQLCSFITNITLASGESFTVSYTDDQVDGFITNIKQDAFHFSYDPTGNTWAKVTNARGVSTRYDFSENQSVSQTRDEYNTDLSYFEINSDISSCMIKNTSDSDEITEFLFGNQSSIDTNSNSTGWSDIVYNNNLQAKKMYLFIAEINGNLASDTFEMLLFDSDNNFVAELVFKGSASVLSFPVGIKDSITKSFRALYKNKCPNSVEIMSVRLVPLIGNFEILCTNVDTGGPIFFYGTVPYYVLRNGNVYSIDNSVINYLDWSITYNDYLRNERFFYKMGSYFHFWCQDYKRLVENASSILISIPNGKYISFDSSRGDIALLDDDFTYEERVEFYRLKGKDDNSFSIVKISHDSSSFHTGYTSFYYEEEETKYVGGNVGYVTYFDYDQNYSLVELNREDGYKEEYVYDSSNNLLSKTTSHTDIAKQIKYEFTYDSNDNMLTENKLVGSEVEQATYCYYSDSQNIDEIQYPNSSFKYYGYDWVTAEREVMVVFGHLSYFEIYQYNTFTDGAHKSLNSTYSHYNFTYSNGRLTSLSYNNQQLFNITYDEDAYNGIVLSTGETITYSNGGYIQTTYDSFGRLYTSNECLYHYDSCSNMSGLTDGYYSATYPAILYTRNFFNQPVIIRHRYNHLTTNLEYDIYQRLVNKTFLYNDDDVYTVDYSYYNKPMLENTVKESDLIYGSTEIDFIDNTDGFSRLTSQKIVLNGNKLFDQTITYCSGGPNDGLTNNMIKSVSIVEWNLPNPEQLFYSSLGDFYGDHYSYDSVGNIISIIRKRQIGVIFQMSYAYDYQSRLVRENNSRFNKSFEYSYDDEGNITSKKEYAYSTSSQLTNPDVIHTYSYDQTYKNRLISFDNETISYDSVGNPTSYRGKTMFWTKGTLLSQVIDGNKYINLTYDGLKQRVNKEISISQSLSATVDYDYNDGLLIRESRGTQVITYLYSHKGIVGFILEGFYDTSGATPVSIDGLYIYEKNMQQDVVAILDTNHHIIAKYAYDAWGNHRVLKSNNTIDTNLSSIGHVNPIRYRSYYYDTDLSMYWLTTRYYDPEIGRFISPDDYLYLDYRKLHGINLYAYCKNNPVMFADPSGHFWWIIVAAVVAVVAVTHTAIKTVQAVHETLAASTEKTILSEEECQAKDYREASIGNLTFYYKEVQTSKNKNRTELEILDSWKFTKEEALMILRYLKYEEGYSYLNITRVYNEWQWHNIAYTLGYKRVQSGSVSFYLNNRDDSHGLLGYLFDFWWLG